MGVAIFGAWITDTTVSHVLYNSVKMQRLTLELSGFH